VLGHLNKTAPSSTIVQFIKHLGEISVPGHLNKTAPSSTIVQFIKHLGEISVLGHLNKTAPSSTIVQFIKHLGEISVPRQPTELLFNPKNKQLKTSYRFSLLCMHMFMYVLRV